MEQFAAIMLIVTCSHGTADCRELPAPQVAYETVQTCNEDMRGALRRSAEQGGEVYGACAAVDPSVLEADAAVYWNLTTDGKLTVDVVDEDASPEQDGILTASR